MDVSTLERHALEAIRAHWGVEEMHWTLDAETLPTRQNFVLIRVSGEKEILTRRPYPLALLGENMIYYASVRHQRGGRCSLTTGSWRLKRITTHIRD